MHVKQTFKITGMDCASCAKSIEIGVGQLAGVEATAVNFTAEKLNVTGTADRSAIISRVRELGYDVADNEEAAPLASNFFAFMWRRAETRLALLGAFLVLPGLFLEEIGGVHHGLIDLLSLLAVAVAGFPIGRSALRALRINREISINVLMTVAAVGAVIIGAYTEAGMVMVLFAVGEALEGFTAERARQSIRSLMTVAPSTAVRLHHNHEHKVDINDLCVGDHILVKPGERVAMDGRVVAGSSAVNQAPITGESELVPKSKGDEVFASSVNGTGALEIEVTHLAEDNTISRIIKLVEEAQERQAPTQRFVDRFARIYTPAVVALAILTAVIPPLFFGQPFLNPDGETIGWLYRALALLVVACPCALVISTPVSIISAISSGARSGVLFKGGAYLEALSRVRAIAFDKTGTLTEGRPSVVALRSAACGDGACHDCQEVLALASAVEQRSEHPLATAITSAAAARDLSGRYRTAEDVTAHMGRGVKGQVAGRDVFIGSHSYFDAAVPHADAHCAQAAADAARGYTPVMVSADGEYLGTISVADSVRETSRAAIAQLRKAGVRAIVILTGDNAQTAAAVAAQVGVTDVRAELLPEEKLAAVEALRHVYGTVAMVGDGINDAPALAASDVGIAIGGAGATAQALETADITLMTDDLRHLPFAVQLSRAAMRTIRANVALSLGIKGIFLLIVLLGWGTMWLAVLADVGTSLLVTLNGMRLLGRRPH